MWSVNVPELRKWMGLDVQDFANLFQVSHSTVYRWETLRGAPPDKIYRMLLTIAEEMRLCSKSEEMAAIVRAHLLLNTREALAMLLLQ